jgi:hypothetical protein
VPSSSAASSSAASSSAASSSSSSSFSFSSPASLPLSSSRYHIFIDGLNYLGNFCPMVKGKW